MQQETKLHEFRFMLFVTALFSFSLIRTKLEERFRWCELQNTVCHVIVKLVCV